MFVVLFAIFVEMFAVFALLFAIFVEMFVVWLGKFSDASASIASAFCSQGSSSDDSA